MDELIKSDILRIFNVNESTYPGLLQPGANHNYFVDNSDENVCHVVLAKEGSSAGSLYNDSSKQIILNSCSTAKSVENFKIEDALTKFLNSKFSEFVTGSKDPANDIFSAIELSEHKSSKTDPKITHIVKMNPQLSASPLKISNVDCDELGYMKFWLESKEDNGISSAFYENPDSYTWVLAIPGFIEDDLGSVKISRQKEESEFYFVMKGVRYPLKSYRHNSNNTPLATPTITEGEFIVTSQAITPVAKLEEFSRKYTISLNAGLLSVTWKKNYIEYEL